MLKPVMLSILTLALVGCGKTAASAPAVAPIDSVFTRKPAAEAKLGVGVQLQEREDSETDSPETTRVGGPSSESKGFRRD